jgi:hypothetical protein
MFGILRSATQIFNNRILFRRNEMTYKYHFTPPRMMRTFAPARPGGKLMMPTGNFLSDHKEVVASLALMSYDHGNKLALKLEPHEIYVLVEEIDKSVCSAVIALMYLPNDAPLFCERARMEVARVLSQYGHWTGGSMDEAAVTALRALQ